MLASHLHRLGSCLAPGATALLGLMPNRAAQKCRHPCHATSFIFSNATPAALTHAPNGCQHRTHTCTPPHTPRLAHATARARLLPRAMSFAAQYCNPPLSPHMSRHPALPMHGAAAWGPGWPRIVGCCCWLFSVPVGVQSCPLVALQKSPDSDLPCSSPVLRHHSLLAGSDAQAGAAPHPLKWYRRRPALRLRPSLWPAVRLFLAPSHSAAPPSFPRSRGTKKYCLAQCPQRWISSLNWLQGGCGRSAHTP